MQSYMSLGLSAFHCPCLCLVANLSAQVQRRRPLVFMKQSKLQGQWDQGSGLWMAQFPLLLLISLPISFHSSFPSLPSSSTVSGKDF